MSDTTRTFLPAGFPARLMRERLEELRLPGHAVDCEEFDDGSCTCGANDHNARIDVLLHDLGLS